MKEIMPFIRRRVVWPLNEWRSGSLKRRHWRHLERTQYQTTEELHARQWERTRQIVADAGSTNGFYRERFRACGFSIGDLVQPDDLRHLPILTKEEIRRAGMSMISEGYDVTRLMHSKTGGSTGKALDLYFTEECSEKRNACALRHDRWTGWEIGEPVGMLWGNPHVAHTLKERLRGWLLAPSIVLDTMHLSETSVCELAREWRRVRPTLLFGHAHSLFLLAQLVQSLGIKDVCPRAVLSTSMMLLHHERSVIEEVFSVRVFDRYGCEEVGLIASECEYHSGLHLNMEHLFVEFIDGNGEWVEPGSPGAIIVTDLENRAMPMIRYRVEDVGVPAGDPCPCGRGLPLLREVTGRTADFLVKPDGNRVAGVSLIENTLTKLPGIDQMQIIQESTGALILNLVAGAGFTVDAERALIAYFGSLFGEDTPITIKLVDRIPQEPSGKYRFSICRMI